MYTVPTYSLPVLYLNVCVQQVHRTLGARTRRTARAAAPINTMIMLESRWTPKTRRLEVYMHHPVRVVDVCIINSEHVPSVLTM